MDVRHGGHPVSAEGRAGAVLRRCGERNKTSGSLREARRVEAVGARDSSRGTTKMCSDGLCRSKWLWPFKVENFVQRVVQVPVKERFSGPQEVDAVLDCEKSSLVRYCENRLERRSIA